MLILCEINGCLLQIGWALSTMKYKKRKNAYNVFPQQDYHIVQNMKRHSRNKENIFMKHICDNLYSEYINFFNSKNMINNLVLNMGKYSEVADCGAGWAKLQLAGEAAAGRPGDRPRNPGLHYREIKPQTTD